jgi:16S rRNA processing protein RimM
MGSKGVRQPLSPGEQYLLVGKVSKPHGIRGEVKVVCFSGDPAGFIKYKRFMLTGDSDEPVGSYSVARSRVQGEQVVLQLDGIDDRNGAEDIAGSYLWLDEKDLSPLAQDEYYWHEMEGVLVVTDTGRQLGRVASIFNNRVYDILVVEGDGEYLIPIDKDVIVDHDKENGILTVSPLPGLLEMNE